MTWIPVRPRFGGGRLAPELRGVVISVTKCGAHARVKVVISGSLLRQLGVEHGGLVGVRLGALADRGLLAITSIMGDDDHPRRLQLLKGRNGVARGGYLEVDAGSWGIPGVEPGKRQHVVEDKLRIVDGHTLVVPLPKWAQVEKEGER